MYNLIVLSHGSMAEGIAKTSQMILGEQEGFESLCLQPGESKENFEKRLEEILNKFEESEVLVLADIYGGTPFNSTMTHILKGRKNINLLTGVNLPMVIEALMSKDRDINEVIDEIKNAAVQGIQDGVKALAQCSDE